MVVKYVLQYHGRHAARAPHKHRFAVDTAVVEVVNRRAPDKETSVALCQLSDYARIVLFALQVHVDVGFASHKSDVCLACKQCGHYVVCAAAVVYFHVKSCLVKVPQCHCKVLRRVKQTVRNFRQSHRIVLFVVARNKHSRHCGDDCKGAQYAQKSFQNVFLPYIFVFVCGKKCYGICLRQ